VEDRVAQHLDLARAAVARVHLDAAIGRVAAAAVVPHVVLDAGEQRVGAVLDRVQMVLVLGLQQQLELPRVVPPGGEQRVRGRCVDVLAAGDRRVPAQALPLRGGRVQQEQVDVAVRGQRVQHAEVAGGQPREAEQGQARRQVRQVRVRAQRRARRRAALGRAGHRQPLAQPPPQAGLPMVALARRPSLEQRRPVERVAVVQLGDVVDAGEPPPAARLVPRVSEVIGQRRQPRLVQRLVDDLQERPHRPLRPPRVLVGVDPGRDRHGVGDHPPGRREVDVRAHAVVPARRHPEAGRHALAQPPLHAPRRHRHDLAGERIGQRVREQRGKRRDERVGAFGPMDVQHARPP
jgi:hypothetical protein